jgi:hypothetical protein
LITSIAFDQLPFVLIDAVAGEFILPEWCRAGISLGATGD